MAYVDFAAIKRLCTLEQVATWLGLNIKNNRCQCPVAEGDGRELVLSYDRGSWTFFGCKKKYPKKQRNSGDAIQLVAHCLEVSEQKAAQHIQTRFHGYTPAQKGLPEGGLDYLEAEHADVQSLGISAEQASELGIGFAPRGTMSKRVLFPLRDQKGKLLACIGYARDGTIKLPKSLLTM